MKSRPPGDKKPVKREGRGSRLGLFSRRTATFWPVELSCQTALRLLVPGLFSGAPSDADHTRNGDPAVQTLEKDTHALNAACT
jgi:hypothetical protein